MRNRRKGFISGLAYGIFGAAVVAKYLNRLMVKQYQEKDRFCGYYMLLDDWLTIREQGVTLDNFFKNYNYETIAIYGLGRLGSRLYCELRDTDVLVKYGIDQRASEISQDIEVKTIDEELEQVDVIVVTPIFDFANIKESLEKRINCPIISLEDVIYPLCKRL